MDRIAEAAETLFSSTSLVDSNARPIGQSLRQRGVKVAAIYFSAHWCPPCRQFTPLLKRAFEQFKSSSRNVKTSVVFVSGDRSLDDMKEYMRESHGDWPAVPPGSPVGMTLNSAFEVRGIPFMIVISETGEVISREGRQEVMSMGAGAFQTWDESHSDVDTSVVEVLKDNAPEVTREAGEILVKLMSNVIRDPQNMKYRQIRLANPKIESKLLSANGAFEILFSVGFEEGTDTLILPFDAKMPVVKAFRDAVQSVVEQKTTTSTVASLSPSSSASLQTGSSPSACRSDTFSQVIPSGSQSSLPADVIAKSSGEREIVGKILSERDLCLEYEKFSLKEAARKCIPLESLKAKVTKKLDALKESEEAAKSDIDCLDPWIDKAREHLLVVELLDWFKNDFFSWMDDVQCEKCSISGRKLEAVGRSQPTSQEEADGASVVEIFRCSGCASSHRMPRYHRRPEVLLTWRKGRCGEWANAFSLILVSLGYETRRVLDWTDHVWCEFWSRLEGRWVHADPCENTMDAPLTYSVGWGKKLTYVIAVSKNEVQDVTWRYIDSRSDPGNKAALSRRTLVSEEWLSRTVTALNDKFQEGLDESVKKQLNERRVKELVELMMPPSRDLSEAEKQGRKTGSLQWRLQRGETGGGSHSVEEGRSFIPTEKEISSKVFHLEYDVVADKYSRPVDGTSISGWKNGIKDCQNVARKEERDWKMVYIARSEGSAKASINWSLDLTGTKLCIKTVELTVGSKCFENGRIIWQLCGGNQCVLPTPGVTMRTEQIAGAKELKVGAMLSGGKGDVAWQHTQLFRTDMNSSEEKPQLKLVVTLQEDK